MIKTNYIKNNLLIIFFCIFAFIFQFYYFQSITPHHDQTFHINWLINLKNADHFLPPNFFINFGILKYDTNGFIYELLHPSHNPIDYHAYLFQINSILIVYLFSLFLTIEPIKLYILVSVLFSSLSIIINYKILIIILKEYKVYQGTYFDNIKYQLIFCLLNISFYKFFFSPLGHHNIGYFFFSLTLYILLSRFFNNSKNFPYIIGSILGFVSYFQITIVLLLFPLISCYFLFNNFKINSKNLINFFKFFMTCFIFYFPFIFLIFNDLLSSNKNFLVNLVGTNSLETKFYFDKSIFWFKKLYVLTSPIIFFGFFLSVIIGIKHRKFDYIQFIVLIHFLVNILLSIFYISYLRNFYYIFNIFLILSSFSLIYLYQKNLILKTITILLISFNILNNSKIILNIKKLENIEPLFYQLYFEDKGKVKNKIKKILSLEIDNFVFFSDFSKNYFKVHGNDYMKKNLLTNKTLRSISNHLNNKDNNHSNYIINNFTKLEKNFHVISFSGDFTHVNNIIIKLQNSDLIEKKCKIELPHIINEPIFRDSGSGEFNINIFLTKINC